MHKLLYIIILCPIMAICQKSVIEYTGSADLKLYHLNDDFVTEYILINSTNKFISKAIIEPTFYEEVTTHIPLIIFPNDSLSIHYDNKNIEFNSRIPIRNNELECTMKLYQIYGEFLFEDFDSQDRVPFVDEKQRSNYKKDDARYFEEFKRHLPKIPFTNDERDSLIYNFYVKRIAYIDNFKKTKELSSQYYNVVTSYLLYRYLYSSIRGFEYNRESRLTKKLKNYLNGRNILNDSLLSNINSYRAFLWFYNQYLTTIRLGRKGSEVEQFLNADTSFSGKSRDRILFALVYENLQKKQRNDTLIKLFLEKCHTSEYIKNITNRLSSLNLATNKQIDITDSQGHQFSIREILDQHKNKCVYIDFWASWCMPCINEMKNSELLSEYYKGKNIDFIYISFDHDKLSWQNVSYNYKSFMNYLNSFLLLNNFNSMFAKKYNINAIPRYILIDKSGKIISADAPRPSDPKLKQLIDKYLNQ